ncbi:hypothetical protein [Bifidobacterium magnum]|uniref:hypothetical protein n=1 Tax=Bifidobacterium magnum TaxID=1692 RepID=UPI0003B7BAA9|nr:hypothetical protein [Bifidobacterium magnum]
MRERDLLNLLKRVQRELLEAALDGSIDKRARDEMGEAEWHISSAAHHIREQLKHHE